MNDHFLSKLYEQPEPEFVKNLQRRLAQNETGIEQGVKKDVRRLFRSHLLVKIAALLVIVGLAGVAISPVRAFVSSLITKIAGQTFVVTNDYTLVIDWQSDGKMSYILRITDQNERNREIIAPESATEAVMLDDKHSAVLIRGGWDVDNQSWNVDHGLRIKWLMDNLTYDLMGDDRDQLIEIAKSTIK